MSRVHLLPPGSWDEVSEAEGYSFDASGMANPTF